MNLADLFLENKIEILDKWIDRVLATYSPDAHRVFKQQKNQFANPVGHNVKITLEVIFDAVCLNKPHEKIDSIIEELVKIRAVQNFTPSAAVDFVFMLKRVIADTCKKESIDVRHPEWLEFEQRLDAVTMKIFDMYMESRERLHKIQINELMKGTNVLTDGTKCPSAIFRQNRAEIVNLRN